MIANTSTAHSRRTLALSRFRGFAVRRHPTHRSAAGALPTQVSVLGNPRIRAVPGSAGSGQPFDGLNWGFGAKPTPTRKPFCTDTSNAVASSRCRCTRQHHRRPARQGTRDTHTMRGAYAFVADNDLSFWTIHQQGGLR